MLPLILAGAAAAAPLIGGAIKAATGAGMDRTQTTTFGQTQQYDPNRFNYGGTPGGADEAANRYRWWADQAQTRGAPATDYGRANQWDAAAGYGAQQAAQARTGQDQLAQMMTQRAMGNVPSIAGMQAQQQLMALQRGGQQAGAQAQAAQMAGAASARGAAGMALAQQNAANNIANAQGAINQGVSNATADISNQAQINAANERLQAENAAFGAYSGMRGGDVSQQGMAGQLSQNAAQQAQFTTSAGLQQRGLNDALTLGMTNAERGVQNDRLQGGIANQQTLAGSFNRQQGEVSTQGAQNARMQNQQYDQAFSGFKDAAAMGAQAKAKGGPVAAGKPYLVGEQGPEIVMPKQPGVVIPAPQTNAILARGGGAQPVSSTGLAKGGRADPKLQEMLDDRWHQNGGDPGTVGAEVLRHPFDPTRAAYPTPWDQEYARQSAEYANQQMGVDARGADQRAFEDRLTGGGQRDLEADNMAEAEKIKRNFGQDDATKQWERINGPASQASAGAREATTSPGTASQLMTLFGGAREEGGPVQPGKAYLVGERGQELLMALRPGGAVNLLAKPALDYATARLQGHAPVQAADLATGYQAPQPKPKTAARIAPRSLFVQAPAPETAPEVAGDEYEPAAPMPVYEGGPNSLPPPKPPPVENREQEPAREQSPAPEEESRGATTALAQAYLARAEKRRGVMDGYDPLKDSGKDEEEPPTREMATFARDTADDQRRAARGTKRGPTARKGGR